MPTTGRIRPINFSTWNADSRAATKNRDEAVAPTLCDLVFVGAAAWPRYAVKNRDEAVAPTLFDLRPRCGSGRLAAIPYPSYSAISMLYIPRTFNGRQFS